MQKGKKVDSHPSNMASHELQRTKKTEGQTDRNTNGQKNKQTWCKTKMQTTALLNAVQEISSLQRSIQAHTWTGKKE